MSDGPSENQVQQAPADAAPQQRARRRERKPKSPEAKVRGMEARRVERQLEAIKATKDVEKLRRAHLALQQIDDGAAPPELGAPQPEKPPAEVELRGTPVGVDTTQAGWPPKEAIADAAPTVREVVDLAAVLLAGTRFDLCVKLRVRVGDEVVERTKADLLAEKLTPLAAKYGMTFASTPEAVAMVGLVTVFGQPLAQMAMERMLGAQAGGLSGAAA